MRSYGKLGASPNLSRASRSCDWKVGMLGKTEKAQGLCMRSDLHSVTEYFTKSAVAVNSDHSLIEVKASPKTSYI